MSHFYSRRERALSPCDSLEFLSRQTQHLSCRLESRMAPNLAGVPETG